jgi:glycosyltransferase involved in cell wall biosynthesis
MSKLSIVVPVFNEASHLEKFVDIYLRARWPLEREWIFVDDASTDGSLDILKRLQSEHQFVFLRQEANRGKGAAVRRGIQASSGDYVLIQDADFEYDPDDVPKLLRILEEDEADVVFGSRFGTAARRRNFHYFTNALLTHVSNWLSGQNLTDMETCYKIFRSDLLKAMQLRSDRFGIEPELTAYVGKTKARLVEVNISYSPRSREEGKKITWIDGLAAVGHIVRFNCMVPSRRAFRNLPERYVK